MNQGAAVFRRETLARRFVYPALLVLGIWLAADLIYESAWRYDLGAAGSLIAWVCGLGGMLFLWLAPLVTYPMTCGRGASTLERAAAGLVPCTAWTAYELYRAAGVFPLGQTLYYGLGSVFVFSFCVAGMVIGMCEIICRRRLKAQGRLDRVRWKGPLAAILAGPLAGYFLLIWGGGVHFFYIYQEGYKLFFH